LSEIHSRRPEGEVTIVRWSTRPTRTHWAYTRPRFPREERKGKGASDHAPVIVELRE
jgi:hypothetical protein